MALIFDLVDPREILGFVREIQRERNENRFVLSQFLPDNNIGDISYRVTRGQLQDEAAAPVRNWDTPAPIGSRQGAERIMGELPPISKKIPVTEEQRIRQRMLERGSNDASELVAAIFADAANMARAVLARVEMFRGEALFTGSIVINENGVKQSIPMGRSTSHNVAANTLTGPDLFSAHTTANPIEFLIGLCQTYNDDNGFDPGLILANKSIVRHLLFSDEVRAYLGTNVAAAAVAGAPAIVTNAALSAVLEAFELPPIVQYDVIVRDLNGNRTRVTPSDQILLLPPAEEALGATFFGTTAESLELVEAQEIAGDEAPGLVAVVDKTSDPVSTWTKVAGIALPVVMNPDYTLAAKVL